MEDKILILRQGWCLKGDMWLVPFLVVKHPFQTSDVNGSNL